MKTQVTIPWEAVVGGCPPSARTARGPAPELPLVVARDFGPRSSFGGAFDDDDPAPALLRALAADGGRPMAMGDRADAPSYVELPLPESGNVCMLTTDRRSSVILQAGYAPHFGTLASDAALCRDAFARTFVARHARFDPDARAFVIPHTHPEPDPDGRASLTFLNPATWGFTHTPGGHAWTATGLFETDSAKPSSHPRKKKPPVLRPRHHDMFGEPTPDRGDPFRCVPQLRQFERLCQHEPDVPESESPAPEAALQLAIGLGRCRLFGVSLAAADDGTLTPATFADAAALLLRYLRQPTSWSHALADGQQTHDHWGAYVIRHIALDFVETRMDAHCAYLALDEAYAAALYDGSPEAPSMSRRLHQVRRLINLFDGNLQKNIPLLRLAASTYLLDNWRRLLAPAYRDCPPWWLDGSIG